MAQDARTAVLGSVLGLMSFSACTAPLSPSMAPSTTWVLSGQSNARELRPALNVLAAERNVTVTGWAEGGDGIINWGPQTAGWIGWVKPALEDQGVQAFIWDQGEYDSGVPLVNAYLDSLTELIGRVRATARDPRLRVVIVGVSGRDDYAAMRSVQEAYVRTDPDSRYILTADLATAEDGAHFTPASYQVIAERVVAAIMSR